MQSVEAHLLTPFRRIFRTLNKCGIKINVFLLVSAPSFIGWRSSSKSSFILNSTHQIDAIQWLRPATRCLKRWQQQRNPMQNDAMRDRLWRHDGQGHRPETITYRNSIACNYFIMSCSISIVIHWSLIIKDCTENIRRNKTVYASVNVFYFVRNENNEHKLKTSWWSWVKSSEF